MPKIIKCGRKDCKANHRFGVRSALKKGWGRLRFLGEETWLCTVHTWFGSETREMRGRRAAK